MNASNPPPSNNAPDQPVLAPPPWPRGDERVLAALIAAYQDGSWGKYQADRVERLEAELAAMHGVSHVLTCTSGTFAVELALRALRLGPGDEVALAGYDFPGNFRAIEAVGARPVLVDIEPQTWTLSATDLAAALGPATKGVIVSHLHGGMADMQAIHALCAPRGVAVVEDACQAPGALVQGRMAGAWGDVGVLSFGGSKLLTAGRGGAILTSDPQLAQRAKIFCERGNHAFPLSELQAAVLLPQLTSFAEENAARQASAQYLIDATGSLPSLAPLQTHRQRGISSYYKLAWLFRPEALAGRTRESMIREVQAQGVAMDAGFRGFAGRTEARCRHGGELLHSKTAASQTVILHHPVLLESERTITHVAEAICRVFAGDPKKYKGPPPA